MDTAIPPLKRTLWRRIKWMWQDNGEWIIAPILIALVFAAGYSTSSWVNRNVVIEVVKAHQADTNARVADWNSERSFFRGNAEKKNDDIRGLTATLAKMGIDTSLTAKTATEATKTATETSKNLSEGKAPQETPQ